AGARSWLRRASVLREGLLPVFIVSFPQRRVQTDPAAADKNPLDPPCSTDYHSFGVQGSAAWLHATTHIGPTCLAGPPPATDRPSPPCPPTAVARSLKGVKPCEGTDSLPRRGSPSMPPPGPCSPSRSCPRRPTASNRASATPYPTPAS